MTSRNAQSITRQISPTVEEQLKMLDKMWVETLWASGFLIALVTGVSLWSLFAI